MIEARAVQAKAEAAADAGADSKPLETKPVETKSAETKSPEGKTVETKAPDPQTTSAVKSVVMRDEVVSGWTLREVYDGAALIESRNRRLFEVVPGGFIPGVGRVSSIERRSGRWIVLTERGVIGAVR
jgi:hypothetical protein